MELEGKFWLRTLVRVYWCSFGYSQLLIPGWSLVLDCSAWSFGILFWFGFRSLVSRLGEMGGNLSEFEFCARVAS
jgi:hypothetical protein